MAKPVVKWLAPKQAAEAFARLEQGFFSADVDPVPWHPMPTQADPSHYQPREWHLNVYHLKHGDNILAIIWSHLSILDNSAATCMVFGLEIAGATELQAITIAVREFIALRRPPKPKGWR